MRIAVFTICFLLTASCLCGIEQNDLRTVSTSGTAAATIAFMRADLIMAKSVLTSTHVRGSIGENVVQKSFLKEVMNRTGNWKSITPRSGRQGFDHLFIKQDKFGNPRQLIVGESKFGSSQLGMTRDGIQMGKKWINNRLLHLSKRYAYVASQKNITLGRMPLNPNRQISVVLRNQKEVCFWRGSSLDNWKFSGKSEQLKEAQRLLPKYAQFFKRAAGGDVVYRSRIFKIVPHGNDLQIKIYDAKNIDAVKNIAKLKQSKPIVLHDALKNSKILSSGVRADMAQQIQTCTGHSEKEAKRLVSEICKKYNIKELMTPNSFWGSMGFNVGIAAGVAMGLDLIITAFNGEPKDQNYWVREALPKTLIVGTSTAAGVLAGAKLQLLLSGPLKCSSPLLATGLSSFGGGAVASALLSYGMWLFGYCDLQTANRQAIIGGVSAGASALAVAGTMGALAIWGTAGTGTAIASLSGAAATNASLALLGGGTIAAGGGGVALGAAILTGGAIVIAAAVAAGVYAIFELKDASDEKTRITDLLNRYSDSQFMDSILPRSLYYRHL